MLDVAENELGLEEEFVIPREIYYDPKIFAQEMDRIFRRTWQCIGHESEFRNTGDYVAVNIAGQPVVVTRKPDGALSAFYNVCTHRGARLTDAPRGNCKNSFVCMYHAWTFDLDGKLRGIPRPDSYGKDFDRSLYDIPKVHVDTHAGFVYINLDDNCVPLEDYLGDIGPLIEDLSGGHEVIGRVSFMMDGNWKLWPENFRDGYHPEYTHPLVREVYRPVPKSAGTIAHYELGHGKLYWPIEGDPKNIHTRKEKILDMSLGSVERAMTRGAPPFKVDWSKGSTILTVFPNLDIQSLMCGTEHIVQVVQPLAPSKSRIDLAVIAPVGESDEARLWRLTHNMDAQGASGKVTCDDLEAGVRCTEGVRADAVPWTPLCRGMSPGNEGHKTEDHGIRGFYRAWRNYMDKGA